MKALEYITTLSLPLIIGVVAILLLFGKRRGFDAFLIGARQGLSTSVSLLPSLALILVGVKMLEASGALGIISKIVSPISDKLGIPDEILPLLLTRPFSGSGSNAVFASLCESLGGDSFPVFCAAVIMGSSDTMVYILGVYFSSIGVSKTKYAFPCAVLVMIFCIFISVFISRIFWK